MKQFTTLTDEEIGQVLRKTAIYPSRKQGRTIMLEALYRFLANAGLRVSEAVAYSRGMTVYPHALRWNKFDFERGEVTVTTLKQHRVKGRKSETIEDTIPLDTRTIEGLLTWRAVSPLAGLDDVVFPISRRVTYNIFQRILHLACIRPIKLHALRHSFITRLIEQTGDLTFAQHMARHRSISSTAKYAHCRRLHEQFAKTTPVG